MFYPYESLNCLQGNCYISKLISKELCVYAVLKETWNLPKLNFITCSLQFWYLLCPLDCFCSCRLCDYVLCNFTVDSDIDIDTDLTREHQNAGELFNYSVIYCVLHLYTVICCYVQAAFTDDYHVRLGFCLLYVLTR